MDNLTENTELHLKAGRHAVLVLHGLGANTLEVTRLAQHLHSGGLSVSAPNILGFCYGMPCSTCEDWVLQMRQHLARLKEQYDTVSVVGLSMGATLAMALAEEEEIESLVLLATALAYDGWAMPWYRFLLEFAPIIPFAKRYTHHECEPYGLKNPDMRAQVKKALASSRISEVGGEALSLDHLQQGDRLIRHARRQLAEISCPTLLIHAVEDDMVCVKNAEWVLNHIQSQQKEIIYLGDSYHMITIDNEREVVFQETERFIKHSVNAALETPAFNMPSVVTRELRRLLRTA